MIEILQRPPLEYNNYFSCVKVLKLGIMATKFNYSNKKHRRIIIKISKCLTKLSYQTLDEDASFWQKLKGPTEIKLDDIIGVIYGGSSLTFRSRKKKVMTRLRNIRKQKEEN